MQRQHLNKDLKRLQVTFSSMYLASDEELVHLLIIIIFFLGRGKVGGFGTHFAER